MPRGRTRLPPTIILRVIDSMTTRPGTRGRVDQQRGPPGIGKTALCARHDVLDLDWRSSVNIEWGIGTGLSTRTCRGGRGVLAASRPLLRGMPGHDHQHPPVASSVQLIADSGVRHPRPFEPSRPALGWSAVGPRRLPPRGSPLSPSRHPCRPRPEHCSRPVPTCSAELSCCCGAAVFPLGRLVEGKPAGAGLETPTKVGTR